jgi:hypothetical protein
LQRFIDDVGAIQMDVHMMLVIPMVRCDKGIP